MSCVSGVSQRYKIIPSEISLLVDYDVGCDIYGDGEQVLYMNTVTLWTDSS